MYAVAAPYPQYFDNDGSPLDSGYVYFGQTGQNPITAPVAVYWDEAGTQPAAQPVRTVNGFLSRSGTPAQIYASAECAVLVKNKRGALVGNGSKSSLVSSSATAFLQSGTAAVVRTAEEKMREIKSFGDVGGIASDSVDQTALLTAALFAYSHLVIDGNVAISSPISIPSRTTLEFRHGAKLIALGTMPHILGAVSSAQNVTIINPEVDGAGFRGLNGFGFDTASGATSAKNIRVINPIARNCLRSATTGGGRGFTTQGKVATVTFTNAKAFDCTTGADVNGSALLGATVGTVIDVLYAENCQEAISLYSDGTGTNASTPPTLPTNVIATIGTVIARNCGRTTDTTLYSGSGTASDADGGVIVSRRGRNLTIGNLIVYNDPGYTIGALFRGTGNNVRVNNFQMWGTAQAVCIIGSAENLLPLTSTNDASYGIDICGKFHGTATNLLDVRIATASNYLTGMNLDIEVDAFPSGNSILTSTSTFRADSKIKVVNNLSSRTIKGSLLDVFTYCNTLTLAAKNSTLCSSAQLYSAQTFEALATFNDDVKIASTSRVDFTASSVGAGAAEGYVLIKVGGATKKIQYFEV